MNKHGSLPRKTIYYFGKCLAFYGITNNINYKNSSDTGLFRKGDTRKHLLDITKESLKKC